MMIPTACNVGLVRTMQPEDALSQSPPVQLPVLLPLALAVPRVSTVLEPRAARVRATLLDTTARPNVTAEEIRAGCCARDMKT